MAELLTPLRYWHITHPMMRRYRLWYPLAGAAVAGVAVAWMGSDFNAFGSQGLVDHVSGLLRVMIGFFLAALGMMHTLSFPGLDEKMRGESPKLAGENGEPVALSRRAFLRELFGYLVLVSLLLYIYGLLAGVLRPLVSIVPAAVAGVLRSVDVELDPQLVSDAMRAVFCATYVFVALNLLTAVMLGVYFLTSRIGPDRAVVGMKEQDDKHD